MINLLALSLVFTSLLAAQVWSPFPSHTPSKDRGDDVIVKEGHRVVVVETYDEHGQHNTKVSISPSPHHVLAVNNEERNLSVGILDVAKEKVKEGVQVTKSKAKEVMDVLPNVGQSISSCDQETTPSTTTERVCDAVSIYTHKIAETIGAGKDKISEAVVEEKEKIDAKLHRVKEAVMDEVDEAKEKARETVNKACSSMVGNISDKMEKGKEKAADAASRIKTFMDKTMTYLVSGGESVRHPSVVVNLLGFATAYGMCVWVTFASTYVHSRVLTRHQFGMVQSKIYPIYYRAMGYSVLIALLGHLVGRWKKLTAGTAESLQLYNLLATFLLLLINAVYMEPFATKVMVEEYKIQKEESRGRESVYAEHRWGGEPRLLTESSFASATRTQFPRVARDNYEEDEVLSKIIKQKEKLMRLNSYSAFLNLLTLIALNWHLVYLGQCIRSIC